MNLTHCYRERMIALSIRKRVPPGYKVSVFAQAVECQRVPERPRDWASSVLEEPSLRAGKKHPLLCGQVRYCRVTKLGPSVCCWVLPSGVVENVALKAHLQLSRGESGTPKPSACSAEGAEVLGSGRISPPIFSFPGA